MTFNCAIDCRLHSLDCTNNSDDLELGRESALERTLKCRRFASEPLAFASTIDGVHAIRHEIQSGAKKPNAMNGAIGFPRLAPFEPQKGISDAQRFHFDQRATH